MTTSVRIVRAVPTGPITRPDTPVPVVVTIHWHRGDITEMDATALAWTSNAVEVEWRSHLGLRSDWIPADQVRRPGQPAPSAPELRTRPRRKNNRW